jgi:trimeric autotransporter adhesin
MASVAVKMPTMASASLAVVDLILFNADTDRPIMSLTANNGTTLSRMALATSNWNIVAVTNHPDPKVGSLRFAYDTIPAFRTEERAPFALAGDDGKGNYFSWTPTLGTHTVTATPFSLGGASGQRGTSQTVTFTVVA